MLYAKYAEQCAKYYANIMHNMQYICQIYNTDNMKKMQSNMQNNMQPIKIGSLCNFICILCTQGILETMHNMKTICDIIYMLYSKKICKIGKLCML